MLTTQTRARQLSRFASQRSDQTDVPQSPLSGAFEGRPINSHSSKAQDFQFWSHSGPRLPSHTPSVWRGSSPLTASRLFPGTRFENIKTGKFAGSSGFPWRWYGGRRLQRRGVFILRGRSLHRRVVDPSSFPRVSVRPTPLSASFDEATLLSATLLTRDPRPFPPPF